MTILNKLFSKVPTHFNSHSSGSSTYEFTTIEKLIISMRIYHVFQMDCIRKDHMVPEWSIGPLHSMMLALTTI